MRSPLAVTRAALHRTGLRLRFGLGNDLDDAVGFDRGESLHAQRREQRRIDERLRHRARRDDVDVPLTRGSTRKLRPVISPTAFTTASMSALTKFSVTVSASCARACRGRARRTNDDQRAEAGRGSGTWTAGCGKACVRRSPAGARRMKRRPSTGLCGAPGILCRGVVDFERRESESAAMIAWGIALSFPSGDRPARAPRPALR